MNQREKPSKPPLTQEEKEEIEASVFRMLTNYENTSKIMNFTKSSGISDKEIQEVVCKGLISMLSRLGVSSDALFDYVNEFKIPGKRLMSPDIQDAAYARLISDLSDTHGGDAIKIVKTYKIPQEKINSSEAQVGIKKSLAHDLSQRNSKTALNFVETFKPSDKIINSSEIQLNAYKTMVACLEDLRFGTDASREADPLEIVNAFKIPEDKVQDGIKNVLLEYNDNLSLISTITSKFLVRPNIITEAFNKTLTGKKSFETCVYLNNLLEQPVDPMVKKTSDIFGPFADFEEYEKVKLLSEGKIPNDFQKLGVTQTGEIGINQLTEIVSEMKSTVKEEIHPRILNKPLQDESPEEYLFRIRKEYKEEKFPEPESRSTTTFNDQLSRIKIRDDSSLAKRKDILPRLFQNINWLKENEKRQSPSKDLAVMDNLQISIKNTKEGTYTGNSNDKDGVASFFNKTRKTRNFFSKKYYENSDERNMYELPQESSNGYVNPMFGIPEELVATLEAQEYLHSIIDNKNIYFFGGGSSALDLIENLEYKPKNIVNLDPYVKSETVDKNTSGAYISLPVSIASPDLNNQLAKEGLPQADQILSLFTAPYYLNSSKEILDLMKNINLLLAPGGEAHIYPVSVSGTENNDDNFLTRKNALLDGVRELMNSSELNISFANGGLHIHKLKKES